MSHMVYIWAYIGLLESRVQGVVFSDWGVGMRV